MKKFVILLGLTLSFLSMIGCATKDANQVAVTDNPAHHDYKGESRG